MMAKCDNCRTDFNSHDGGAYCTKCMRTFCPACEELLFDLWSTDMTCNQCKHSEKAEAHNLASKRTS